MRSLPTEISETEETNPSSGWIFYDRDCGTCSNLAERFTRIFAKRGYVFAPLQEKWVSRALHLTREEALAEMRVLTRDGTAFAGADAIIFLAQQIWWTSPLALIALFPGARGLLRRGYHWIAAHRNCAIARRCTVTSTLRSSA